MQFWRPSSSTIWSRAAQDSSQVALLRQASVFNHAPPFGLYPLLTSPNPCPPLWVPVRPSQDSGLASPAAHISSEGRCCAIAVGQHLSLCLRWLCSCLMVLRSSIRLLSTRCTCSILSSQSSSLFTCLSGISAEIKHAFPSPLCSRALGLNKSSCSSHPAKGTRPERPLVRSTNQEHCPSPLLILERVEASSGYLTQALP